MLASPIPTAQRVQRDTWVANPNGTASHARPRDAPVRSPPLRLALRTAMYHASCVSVPLRSAKRPLHAYIHKSTNSARLPRFRHASHIHSRTRTQCLARGCEIQLPRTIPCACHAKRCPATHQATPFPTPTTTIHTRVATRSRHAALQRPMAAPKRTRRGRSRTLADTRRTRRENESNTTPPPDPNFKTRTLRYAFGKNKLSFDEFQ